jgi:MFS family permease
LPKLGNPHGVFGLEIGDLIMDASPILPLKLHKTESKPISKKASWWMVFVLFLSCIFSFLDRGIIGLVVDPIRHDLHISEIQMSLLQGLSFGIFYATVGLFLGLGADRFPRRILLICGISVWSVGTVLCGLSQSFLSLFLSRLMVGAGEATLIPVSISLIADMFGPERRGAPLSLFYLGTAIAGGLAALITGILLANLPLETSDSVATIFGLSAWRASFIICGFTGLILVPLLLTTKEPLRQAIDPGSPAAGIANTVGYFKSNYRLFVPLYLGFSLVTSGQYGLGAWAPSLLVRHFGVAAAEVGKLLGSFSILAGMIGSISAAFIVDFVTRRLGRDAKILVLAIVAFSAMPSALAVFMPTLKSAAIAVAWMNAITPFASICFSAIIQDLVPSNMRGVSMAIALFVNTLIASTIGTMLIAIVTQKVFENDLFVGYSVAIVLIPALLLSSMFIFISFRVQRANSKFTL